MLVSWSEFSSVLGMNSTEKRWHVCINIQKYVLPVHLNHVCEKRGWLSPEPRIPAGREARLCGTEGGAAVPSVLSALPSAAQCFNFQYSFAV